MSFGRSLPSPYLLFVRDQMILSYVVCEVKEHKQQTWQITLLL
jgi:hypothetical protein